MSQAIKFSHLCMLHKLLNKLWPYLSSCFFFYEYEFHHLLALNFWLVCKFCYIIKSKINLQNIELSKNSIISNQSLHKISVSHQFNTLYSVALINLTPGPFFVFSKSGICSVVAMILWGAYIHDTDAYVFGPGFVTCLTSAFLVVLGGVEIHRATMSHQSNSRGE